MYCFKNGPEWGGTAGGVGEGFLTADRNDTSRAQMSELNTNYIKCTLESLWNISEAHKCKRKAKYFQTHGEV